MADDGTDKSRGGENPETAADAVQALAVETARLTEAAERAAAVRDDVFELLEVDIRARDWEGRTGVKKAFYVRGFSWFRERVLGAHLKVTACESYVELMKTALGERPSWTQTKFTWDEPFGPRQFVDAASDVRRATPKFHKAAEIVLMCEVIARDLHNRFPDNPHPDQVYQMMRIEPAVSLLKGLTKEVIDQLSDEEATALMRFTGQDSLLVFYDMAARKSVTHKLVLRTHRYFQRRKRMNLGLPTHQFWSEGKYKPSRFEVFDVDEINLPLEARLAADRNNLVDDEGGRA